MRSRTRGAACRPVHTWRRLKCQFWLRHIHKRFGVHALGLYGNAPYRMCTERYVILFDLGGAGLRTELKHIIKCRKRNQMGFP